MKWNVAWSARAEDRLAELWMASSRRNEVTMAAEEIQDVIERNPVSAEEGREFPGRILFVRPLGDCFDLDIPCRGVTIRAFWEIK